MAEYIGCDRCSAEETVRDIRISEDLRPVTIEVHVWLEKKYLLCPECQAFVENAVREALQQPPQAVNHGI